MNRHINYSPSVLARLLVEPEVGALMLVLGPSELLGQLPLRFSCNDVVVVWLGRTILGDGLPVRLDLGILPQVLMGLGVVPAHVDVCRGLSR